SGAAPMRVDPGARPGDRGGAVLTLRGGEARPDLEEPDVPPLMPAIVCDRLHETREERPPQDVELARERVGDADDLLGMAQAESLLHAALDEGVGDGLGEPGGEQDLPDVLVAGDARV